MDTQLRRKLEDIHERHDELGEMLCAPEIVGDKTRFLSLSREHAELRPVAEAFGEYQNVERELEQTRALLGDPDMRELAEADLPPLRERLARLDGELQKLLLPRDPNDGRDVLLEIRAGTGGEEAALFAGELWRMYSRYAERQGWKIEPLTASDAAAGGLKEVICVVRGKNVYGRLKFESGVHRVQRVPATEAQGRIHTSAATVAIMPEADEVDVHVNESDLRVDTMRSSGSGGQHVNTTDSKVRITHVPSGIVVESQQEKSQIKNREIAMTMLRTKLLDVELQKQQVARAAARKSQVGSGDRSEKVRTYNFPQDRVTDHRIGLTRHNIDGFMAGDLDDVVDALCAHDEAERLAESQGERP
ncbi:MAG: peptide chain release factor 1 [Nannocystaceae bacterium]|nr:peptide chain release factor 1 [Nannocystaceae bacterium]